MEDGMFHTHRRFWLKSIFLPVLSSTLKPKISFAADDAEAFRKKLRQAVVFYATRAAKHGGYVYQYSADLKKSEGEGVTGPDTVWVQPPGTPSVGLAMLQIYQRTGLIEALDASIAAAECLVKGQLHSGCWNDKIEFAPDARKKFAYKVDGPLKAKAFNVSTFDDDKTQSAIEFLLYLNEELKGKNKTIRESLTIALNSLVYAQFPNGGFAQGFAEPADKTKPADLKASYPETWPRTYPGGKYWFFYTFNDGNIDNLIKILFLAERIQKDEKYRTAALKSAEFILHSQMPDPQPAWAQQYDFDMKPVWARKFEPPSISGGESQRLLNTLMDVYLETGEKRYLAPIAPALAWLEKSRLPDGRIARFFELKTNKPLYFTKKYELTYDDTDLPTHYGFKVDDKTPAIRKRFDKISVMTERQRLKERDSKRKPRQPGKPSLAQVQKIMAGLDERGAWVEAGKLGYHPKGDPTREVIRSETFMKNSLILADWLAANAPRT